MIDFSPMMLKQPTPKVGVAVFIERHGKILLLKRKGSHRSETWALPGGHMDVGESDFNTCAREIKEELDLNLRSVKHFDFANTIFENEGLHYITLYFTSTWDLDQEPKIMEPLKIEKLGWFYPTELPNPIFSINASKMIEIYAEKAKETRSQLLREVYWERG